MKTWTSLTKNASKTLYTCMVIKIEPFGCWLIMNSLNYDEKKLRTC